MLPIRDSARVAGKETKSDDAKSRCSENHSNLYFNLISQFFQRLSGLFMKVFSETFFVKKLSCKHSYKSWATTTSGSHS